MSLKGSRCERTHPCHVYTRVCVEAEPRGPGVTRVPRRDGSRDVPGNPGPKRPQPDAPHPEWTSVHDEGRPRRSTTSRGRCTPPSGRTSTQTRRRWQRATTHGRGRVHTNGTPVFGESLFFRKRP